jgi:hypothetical protein
LLFNLIVDLALGDQDLPEGYELFKTREGTVQAVTPAMAAKKMRISSKDVTKTLGGIGVVAEPGHIYIDQGPDKKPGRKSIRALVFPDEHRWIEASRRYRTPRDEEVQVGLWDPCPDALKGSKYTGMMEINVVNTPGTDGTDGTDQEERPPIS